MIFNTTVGDHVDAIALVKAQLEQDPQAWRAILQTGRPPQILAAMATLTAHVLTTCTEGDPAEVLGAWLGHLGGLSPMPEGEDT